MKCLLSIYNFLQKRYILSVFVFLFGALSLFAQDSYQTLLNNDTLALFSNDKYIVLDGTTLGVADAATSIDALWVVTNNKLKSLASDRYVGYNNGYQTTATLGNATDVSATSGYWYIYRAKQGNSYRYYRPSISNRGAVSSTNQTENRVSRLDNTTKAYKISTISEGGEIIVGERIYGEERKVVTKDEEIEMPYTGGSCDLGQAIKVVLERPYSVTTTVGEKRYYYATTDGTTIKILKSTEPVQSTTDDGVEQEVLDATVTVKATNEAIVGQTIKGTSVVLPMNTSNEDVSAEYDVQVVAGGETYTQRVRLMQARNTTNATYREFSHKVGQANSSLGTDGLQQVHTHEDIIYALTGENKTLRLQVASGASNYVNGFYRWFNYDADATVATGLNHTATYNYTANGKGVYVLRDTRPGETTYTMDGYPIRVACDVSQYADYEVTTTTLVEPTLSYRMIYDIRPAEDMATMLDRCSSAPLEEYKILAPAGQSIRIGPKYKWTGGEAYVNYYYTSGGSVVRLNSYEWRKNGSSYTASNIVDNRLITVTAPSAGSTDTYELRTPTGLIIARFEVTAQSISAIGPSTTTIKSNAELDQAYDLKAYRNFDYTDESGTIYSKPLPWEESTYGFAYTTGVAGSNKARTSGFADWSEYLLINHSNLGKSWLQTSVKDHSTAHKTKGTVV